MTLADTDRIEVLLHEYQADVGTSAYTDLETEGVTRADNYVTRYIKKKLPDYTIIGTEDDIIDAATLRAAGVILTVLKSNDEKSSQAVTEWFKECDEALDSFIENELTDEDEDLTVNTAFSIEFD